MPLHIDKRPDKLENFWGNDGLKSSLNSVFLRDDKPHSSLFVGPSGCGKTTLARIVANMIGCHPEGVLEYNSANLRGIDTIRAIAEDCMYAPMSGPYRVYVLDEVHALTKDAQNALLKVLEDTPKHVFFMLCTTDPEKLIAAIRTRCMRFEVKSLPSPLMTKLVKQVIESEGIQIADFPEKVIASVVKNANGCPRQALILLDSVIDIVDEEKALLAIAEAMGTETDSTELFKILLKPSYPSKWDDVRFLLKGLDAEPESLRYGLLSWFSTVLISSGGADAQRASDIIDLFTESFMYSKKAGMYNAFYYACKL